MEEQKQENFVVAAEEEKGALVALIETAIKVPGIKVNRDEFLREQFKKLTPERIEEIVETNPIAANCTRKELNNIAQKLITKRTTVATTGSFLAGLPGGLAMVATIPADIMQFYAVALRLAQELMYLYGEPDLWEGGEPDEARVMNQLILYCGVMLGAGGAAQAVRVMASTLAKQALAQLPKKALTKTLIFKLTKSIVKAFGIKLTKATFSKGVSKVIPVVGGVVSGGLTLASMLPMAKRLAKTLDTAKFEYSEEDFKKDFAEVEAICEQETDESSFEVDGDGGI